ncbi:9070_t:CDS:2, partial [Racocetra fulgida]
GLKKTKNQYQKEVLKTHNDNSSEFNDIEDRDGEISILRIEEANDVITKLMQAVSEVTTHRPLVYIGNSVRTRRWRRQIQRKAAVGTPNDSETSESNFEVGTAKDHMIYIEKLEIKSNKYNEVEKARLYAILSYFHLVEQVRKGLYMDGHEQADVVAYRERFLEKIAEYEAQMVVFSGENMEEETRPASQIIILVTHNKYIFSTYNGRHWLWMPEGEQPLCKKDQGRSFHVSEFLTDIAGRLVLCEEDKDAFPELPSEAYIISYPSKDDDKW